MTHNLNLNEQTGKHRFFSVKEKAWYGLGQIVEGYPTSAEALKFAGLDYTVAKRKLFKFDNENEIANEDKEIKIPEIEVPNFYATIRTDNETVLGVVGKDYEVVQNINAFSFFDSIVGGAYNLIEQYLFLTTSHDAAATITVAFIPVRIVYNNTLNAALRNHSNAFKIRHTVNVKERLEEAHKLMGITNQLSNELEGIFNQ